MTKNNKNNKRLASGKNRGFAALYVAIIVLALMTGIALLLTFLTVNQQMILGNYVKSYQSYSLAESGIEDALLRLSKNMIWSSPYNLTLGNSSSIVEISDNIGGTRTITSTGNVNNRIRKVQVVFTITNDKVSFNYGAQVGDGGMVIRNNSTIDGNVFSNGNVIGGGNHSEIAHSIIVAGSGNILEKIEVGEDATAHHCRLSHIGGTLTYVSGGEHTCTYDIAEKTRPNAVEKEPLPISASKVQEWKLQAANGGTIGSKIVSGNESLGPVKIEGNLTVNNGKTLTVDGTIYVTGNIIFSPNAIIKLASSYGPFSGMIIADGTITLENGVILSGSGEPSSYMMVLSTNSSLDPLIPAIDVRNGVNGGIIYTTNGIIYLKNSMTAREITGYMIQVQENITIVYESGLQDAIFTAGPGGSWKVASWKEIE